MADQLECGARDHEDALEQAKIDAVRTDRADANAADPQRIILAPKPGNQRTRGFIAPTRMLRRREWLRRPMALA